MTNNETIKLPGLKEFILLMTESVKETVGEGHSVEVNHVIKNNSIELDGLTILKSGERITPNIYLNPYYERYLTGVSIKELADEIIQIYNRADKEEKDPFPICFEFNEMKSCIIYRLVNYDKNRKLLQEVPHVYFMDLAITFHCLVKNNSQGIGTIRITNEHIKNWNIGIEDLKEIARINTPAIFPAVIQNMNDVILNILKNEMHVLPTNDDSSSCSASCGAFSQSTDQSGLSDEELFEAMPEGAGRYKTKSMYVISNNKGINGASCLLYPDVIKNLAEELKSDLYLLPSSIHEIIAVNAEDSMDKDTLREMVFDVNRTQVPEEDVLSDSVYFYSREHNTLTI